MKLQIANSLKIIQSKKKGKGECTIRMNIYPSFSPYPNKFNSYAINNLANKWIRISQENIL